MASTIIPPVPEEEKKKPFWEREGYKSIMNSGAKLPSSASIMPLVKPEDKSKPFWEREGYKPIMNSGAKLPSSAPKPTTAPMKDLFSSAFEQINADEEKRKKNPWAFV
jgi:hypothetical protein